MIALAMAMNQVNDTAVIYEAEDSLGNPAKYMPSCLHCGKCWIIYHLLPLLLYLAKLDMYTLTQNH